MDTVSQFLTRIRNAGLAKHEKVDVPASNMRIGIVEILAAKGLVRSYRVAKDSKQGVMRIYLRYNASGEHAMSEISAVSKPERRVYVAVADIPTVRSGLGMCILSTNKGLMDGDAAKKENLGGELICKIW